MDENLQMFRERIVMMIDDDDNYLMDYKLLLFLFCIFV
jgi:hypothetical protein